MAEEAEHPIPSVQPGEILGGKFRVERVIGSGGMGTVVAATHLQLDQRVALKFLHPEAARNEAVVARFQREAKAAAKIRSEHVARVIDVGVLEDGKPFIVMEYLEGRDLGDLIERGALPIQIAVDYLMQACEALAEAHAAGIVHRDLKPSNLFLARQPDDSEIVKVLDFGISKTIEPSADSGALTRTADVFGSPTYMSPEQLKASRNVDARADIWALGVILYELLTTRVPFGGETVPQIFGAILYEPAPRVTKLRKEVPAGLESVLLRCLEKEPEQRYPNVVEFASALVRFGSNPASVSVGRMSRVLAKRSAEMDPARLSQPERASRSSQSAIDDVGNARTVASSTGPGQSPNSAGASPGQTATAWDQAHPQRRSTWRLPVAIIAAALGLGGVGMYWLLGRPTPAEPAPAAETIPVAPAPAEASPPPVSAPGAAAPATAVAAPAPAPEAPAAASPTSAAATGSANPSPALVSRGAPVPRAPAKAAASSSRKPPGPGAPDDEFGGRR
jgi:eukaryotic-like serine/threonine-protein kinase